MNPLDTFDRWYEIARLSIKKDPNAMVVSTSVMDVPDSRIVLMKHYDQAGFVFFTNYESKKGDDMFVNRHVSLLFYWPELGYQVRIQGKAFKTSEEESEDYFNSRSYLSRVGAIVSPQSREIPSKASLFFKALKHILLKPDASRKPNWGGYRIIPYHIEYWHEGPFRFHSRTAYDLTQDGWIKKTLAP